jgi:hypothetical protein
VPDRVAGLTLPVSITRGTCGLGTLSGLTPAFDELNFFYRALTGDEVLGDYTASTGY